MRLLVFSAVCLCTLPVAAAELIGATVPPYPNGMTSDMGTCIPMGGDICAYSIGSLSNQNGAVVAVAALQSLGRVDGKAVWKIFDTLDAPEQSDDQTWAFEECHVDGTIDPSAIGLVTFKDMGGWIETDQTVWAVRFDTKSKTLVELDPGKVRCVLPGS